MKERVVFEANVPVTATLAYADGLKVQGRFGDQVMYSLTDGRVMYVPPVVRDKLVELGIRQNEPFAICRAECRDGNRRFADWVAQPDGSAVPAQNATAHGDTPGSPINGDNGARVRPNGNGNGNGKPASAPTKSGTAETDLLAGGKISVSLQGERHHGRDLRMVCDFHILVHTFADYAGDLDLYCLLERVTFTGGGIFAIRGQG